MWGLGLQGRLRQCTWQLGMFWHTTDQLIDKLMVCWHKDQIADWSPKALLPANVLRARTGSLQVLLRRAAELELPFPHLQAHYCEQSLTVWSQKTLQHKHY